MVELEMREEGAGGERERGERACECAGESERESAFPNI